MAVDLNPTGYIVVNHARFRKTDYALRALFTLVDHYRGAPIPIRELARRNDVPKRFLEQIMLDLKTQGWVDSTAGIRGGYVLARSPEKITMGEVVRHFDGILAPIDCVSVTGYKRCSQESGLPVPPGVPGYAQLHCRGNGSCNPCRSSQRVPVSKQEVSGTFSGGEGI
jgi:Rrf2 family protein